MKLIFGVTLCLILCNFNVDSYAIGLAADLGRDIAWGTIDYAKQSIEKRVRDDPLLSSIASFFGKDLKKRTSTEHPSNPKDDNKFKFTDLNVDCAFLIFEHLSLRDLLNVAQVSPEISMVAAAVFRLKYSHLQVVVSDSFEHPDENKPIELFNVAGVKIDTDTVERAFQRFGLLHKNEIQQEPMPTISNSKLRIHGYNTTLNIFKHFGHVITKFKFIHNNFRDLQMKFIGELIGNYSSESLVEVEFEYCFRNTLKYIIKPLINVQSATFTENFKVIPDTPPPNEIFPVLRRLNLEFIHIGDGLDYFDCYMPHLEHIFIKGGFYTNDDVETNLENMIMKNPQIRSIDLRNTRPAFVLKVNELLPKIENLTLSHFRLSNGSIEFKNVNTFSFDHKVGSPENLHFPRLQTLYIVFNEEHFTEWRDFLNEHNHLNHLHLKHRELSDSHFQKLAANLTNLEYMTLRRDNENSDPNALNTAVIVEFLESHPQLMQFNIVNYPKSFGETLEDQLKYKWNTKLVDDGLSFERRMVHP